VTARSQLIDAPPLRQNPDTPDALDGARLMWARGLWHGQDDVLRQRDRQVEENLRMLAGQQNIVYNTVTGRWQDITNWLTDEERKWRQRPIVNRLLYWFTLTHSRLTENPPIVAFKPASLDRRDAMLAEVMDPVYKTVWQQCNMDDVVDERASVMIPCGEAFTVSRLDMTAGELRPRVGPAMLRGQSYRGEPLEMYADAVPYDEQGQPLAQLAPDGSYYVTGEPFMEPEGQIVVDVLNPIQVRGEWGQKAWDRKNWHMYYAYVPLQDIKNRFGLVLEGENDPMIGSATELGRILMGSGYFGSMSSRTGSEGIVTNYAEGYIGVWTMWQRPQLDRADLRATPESPGGRLMIFTKTRVLYDGPREARYRYTSPIRRYQFVRVPGRPGGTSPQEPMNSLQRAYNKGWGQIIQHRDLATNPFIVLDQHTGLNPKDMTNRPGLIATVIRRAGIPPIEMVSPPRLGEEVFRTQGLLREEMQDFGSLEGTEGRPPTTDASGQLVRELRQNSDRYLSATARRSVIEDARMIEDWIALLEVSWDQQKIITYAGEDQAATTVVVMPDMFREGRVNVVPDIESALPEGRGEREAKLLQLYRDGVFGLPGSPEAARVYLDMFRFPHLGRAAQWGRTDGVTARQENARLAMGEPAEAIPLFPWYSDEIHIAVHEEYMKAPEFVGMDPMIQQQFMMHWQAHSIRFQETLLKQAALAAGNEEGEGSSESRAPAGEPAGVAA
jgi:hypothetical protein